MGYLSPDVNQDGRVGPHGKGGGTAWNALKRSAHQAGEEWDEESRALKKYLAESTVVSLLARRIPFENVLR